MDFSASWAAVFSLVSEVVLVVAQQVVLQAGPVDPGLEGCVGWGQGQVPPGQAALAELEGHGGAQDQDHADHQGLCQGQGGVLGQGQVELLGGAQDQDHVVPQGLGQGQGGVLGQGQVELLGGA